MPNVLMSGWQRPVQKIELVKVLQSQADMSLTEAKHTVECVLEIDPIIISLPTVAAAEQVARAASRLGVSATDELVQV